MAAQLQSWIDENQALVIRRPTPADAEVCGRIGFDAFATPATKYNFLPDFPGPEIPFRCSRQSVPAHECRDC